MNFSQDFFDLLIANADGQPITPVRRFPQSEGERGSIAVWDHRFARQINREIWIGGRRPGYCGGICINVGIDPRLAELHPKFYLLNPGPVKAFRKTAPKTKRIAKMLGNYTRYLGVPDQELHTWQPDADDWALRFSPALVFAWPHQLRQSQAPGLQHDLPQSQCLSSGQTFQRQLRQNQPRDFAPLPFPDRSARSALEEI
jgi:hypothetical protein